MYKAPKKIAACSIIRINTPNTYNKNILLSLNRKNNKDIFTVGRINKHAL
jgi:hypothetical protein